MPNHLGINEYLNNYIASTTFSSSDFLSSSLSDTFSSSQNGILSQIAYPTTSSIGEDIQELKNRIEELERENKILKKIIIDNEL